MSDKNVEATAGRSKELDYCKVNSHDKFTYRNHFHGVIEPQAHETSYKTRRAEVQFHRAPFEPISGARVNQKSFSKLSALQQKAYMNERGVRPSKHMKKRMLKAELHDSIAY
jgi:hypothetical protein